MSTYYGQEKSTNICVDVKREGHKTSKSNNQQGGLLYVTEMEGGASDESKFPTNRELSCAACSTGGGTVYTRYGHTECPTSNKKLYEGFLVAAYYSHNGGGANYICMHPQPQYPSGYSNGSQEGNLLYGTEYQNQGSSAGNKNNDHDAACAVCQEPTKADVYIQWGRKTCSNSHKTEYYGLIMANYYTYQKKLRTFVLTGKEKGTRRVVLETSKVLCCMLPKGRVVLPMKIITHMIARSHV
jgi:hypothetical protein